MSTWLLLGLAIIALILVPFAPALVRLRIKFLKRLNWNWAVNLLESHFQGWVVFFRGVLFVVAIVLLFIAWIDYTEQAILGA
jgi:hypothetical protein